jgi:hypothetical protein
MRKGPSSLQLLYEDAQRAIAAFLPRKTWCLRRSCCRSIQRARQMLVSLQELYWVVTVFLAGKTLCPLGVVAGGKER